MVLRWLAFLPCLATTLLGTVALSSLSAQPPRPPQPPTPQKFTVTFRYDLLAPRDQHVAQYDALIEYLKKLDFAFDPPLADRPNTDREDYTKNRMQGSIAGDKALRLLGEPTVAALLLVPDDFKLPEDPQATVLVRLQLGAGLALERQREFSEQVLALLRVLGFREAVGYDTRGYSGQPFTRLVGTVPANRLDTLLKDLRTQPGGWFAPIIPRADLPMPLREINPVRVVEVLRDTEPLREPADPAPREEFVLEKISPELWEIVGAKEVDPKPLRIQVILVGAPTEESEWRRSLRETAPDLLIEGQLGQFVTAVVPGPQVKALALLPIVAAVRIPHPAVVGIDPGVKRAGANARVLDQSGVAALHARGGKGKGVRLGIIDTDFRGWQTLMAKKLLPAGTRLVDFTTERDPEIRPAPYAGDAELVGHGTLCAQAAALAAPEAQLTLIRIDAVASYQLQEVGKAIEGSYASSLVLRRRDELIGARALLDARRAELLRERRFILDDFKDETDIIEDYGFLGAVMGWLYSDREWHRSRMAYQERLEQLLRERDARFSRHLADLRSLQGIALVANSLGWPTDYPLGAASPLSRWFESRQGKAPLWFQAVGNTRGQSWVGPARSLADSPPLEFAPADAMLPPERWTSNLNFLEWKSHLADAAPALPEKTRLRLTLQWREPHDPDYFPRGDEDQYLRPLTTVRLSLLQQRDPEGKTIPADVFDVIARSTGVPQRLQHMPSASIYELALETTLEKAGHYAVRLERQPETLWILEKTGPDRIAFRQLRDLNPTGIRPLGGPADNRTWEFRPRLFVETRDEPNRLQGRVVLGDFHTDLGSVGIPADSRGVVSVGTVNLNDQPDPSSATGALPMAELARRPTLVTYDALELAGGGALGTSISAAYAAGATAALISTGVSRDQATAWLGRYQGQVLRVSSPAK